MSGQLDLIDLGTYSPKEARMIATALACRGLTNLSLADENWATASDYRDLAAKVDQRRSLS